MVNNQKSILVFGGSDYQLSLVIECKKLNLFTVVIDPNPEAVAKDYADAFEEVGGQDFEGTCKVVEKYNVDAIITAATDKPLVMMARIAKKYSLNFFSEETATVATDKFLMKKKFAENNLPHAKGKLTEEITDDFQFPVVIKPTDNSGSRGVIFCDNIHDANEALNEAKQHTRKNQLLVEEVIEGTEYSIETLHYNGKSKIIQITEKIVTPLPYFVELGHIQPHNLPASIVKEIEDLMVKVANIFNFENCGCHNEVKIKDGKITLIEVSPRIGGDFISSTLALASTGINMEKALIQIVLGEEPDFSGYKPAASGIFFFHFKQGVFKSIKNLKESLNRPEVLSYKFDLKPGDIIPKINVGTKRYGYAIIKEETRKKLLETRDEIMNGLEVQIEEI
jgi:carbamoyl-phosphate synthase large subunit